MEIYVIKIIRREFALMLKKEDDREKFLERNLI